MSSIKIRTRRTSVQLSRKDEKKFKNKSSYFIVDTEDLIMELIEMVRHRDIRLYIQKDIINPSGNFHYIYQYFLETVTCTINSLIHFKKENFKHVSIIGCDDIIDKNMVTKDNKKSFKLKFFEDFKIKNKVKHLIRKISVNIIYADVMSPADCGIEAIVLTDNEVVFFI